VLDEVIEALGVVDGIIETLGVVDGGIIEAVGGLIGVPHFENERGLLNIQQHCK